MFKSLLTVFLIAAVAQCAITPVEDEPSLEKLQINWPGILQCLQEAAPYAPDVVQLITLIRQKKYDAAFQKAIELITKGSQVVIKCAGYIKNKRVNLTVDWKKAAECLVKVASSAGPSIAALVKAIASKDVAAIAIAVTQVVTALGGIPSQCQKFW